MPKTAVEQAVQGGIQYITSQQLASGGFNSSSSSTVVPFQPRFTFRTTFTTSLILAALASTQVPGAQAVRTRAAHFLRAQAGPNWSFNYWAKRTAQRRDQPYPDDLDDTFCALAALYGHEPGAVDATVLAKAIKMLLATESAVGGPYQTWLVPADSKPVWLDVDVAVNANVAYFLALLDSPLPKLVDFLDQAITQNQLKSPYYPSAHMVAYYISRGYKGTQADRLAQILRSLLSVAGTPLETALCASSLLRLGTELPKVTINDLLASQQKGGAWAAAAFCLDPEVDGQPYYNGAAALTTALAVEALQLYQQATQAPSQPTRPNKGKTDQTKTILELAKSQCQELAVDLRQQTLAALETIATGEHGAEIVGLAEHFHQSLIKPPPRLSKDFIARLGLANLYGWLAYTIYDDFLDEEGKPGLVPVANVAMRRSLDNYFMVLPRDQEFHQLVRQLFDAIDSANAWEVTHCRSTYDDGKIIIGQLPDYGNLSKLAERSIGHALSPIAVLAVSGISTRDPATKHFLKAFRHYLIARQLNDDAHDWPEDLAHGRLTPVVVQVLSELGVGPGSYQIEELMKAARPQFWNTTLIGVCSLMRRHIRLSRQALKRCHLLKPSNVLDSLLDGLEASVQDTLAQQSQAKDFLKQYQYAGKKVVKL